MPGRIILVLVSSLLCLGQNVINGPIVANVTHSTARVVWITDTNLTSAEVEWSSSESFGNRKTATRTSSAPYTSTAVISGLAPSSTYYVRARMNGGTLSSTVSFTTLDEPGIHPEVPIHPAPVDLRLPPGDFNGDIWLAPDCSNIGDVFSALASLTGDNHQRVIHPAGTQCVGQFVFPPRPTHSGWVIWQSDKVGTPEFPPDAVRWTKNWTGTTGVFVTNSGPHRMRGVLSSFPGPARCATNAFSEGGMYYVSGLSPATFPMLRCSDRHSPYTGSNSVAGNTRNTITAPGHTLEPGMMIDVTPGVTNSSAKRRHIVTTVDGDTLTVDPAISTIEPVFQVIQEWRQAPHTIGAGAPMSSCTSETWYWDTSAQQMYWCVDDRWVLTAGTNKGDERNSAAIQVRRGAGRIRFIGIEVTGIDVPKPMPEGWDVSGNTVNNQGLQALLIMSEADDVIWERMYIHGHPKPARFHKGISLSGDRVAVIDSYFEDFQEWRSSGYAQTDSAHCIAHYSGGPALIRNNHLEAAGITYFAPNTAYGRFVPPHDVTIVRNTFKKRPEWRRTESQTTIYPERHAFELKQGERYLLEGNRFEYKWAGINQGASMMITPRCSAIPAPVGIAAEAGLIQSSGPETFAVGDVILISGTGTDHDGLHEIAEQIDSFYYRLRGDFTGTRANGMAHLRAPGRRISDVIIRSNLFHQGTELLRVAGSDADCSFRPPSSRRLLFEQNLAVDFDIRRYSDGGRVDSTGIYATNGDFGARALYILNGEMEDVIFRSNTMFGWRGTRPTMVVSSALAGSQVEGFVMNDNIQTLDSSFMQGIRNDTGALIGRNALNAMFQRDGRPNWTAERNVICCGHGASAVDHPVDWSWPEAVEAVGWMLPSLTEPFDFRLNAESQLLTRLAAVESRAPTPGVDGDLLESKLGTVAHTHIAEVNGTSAVIRYMAPDDNPCTVQYSADPQWSMSTRAMDTGGERWRSLRLGQAGPADVDGNPQPSLPSGTDVYYRVLCAVQQPSGSFPN